MEPKPLTDEKVRMLVKRAQEIRVLANEADAVLYDVFRRPKGNPTRELQIKNAKRLFKRIETLVTKG